MVVRATLAALLVVAGAATSYLRWDRAPVHGADLLVTRTTGDGVTIEVERGDVRWDHLFCADGQTQCTERAPGLWITFTLPDGRSGGATIPDSFGPVPDPRRTCAPASGPPPVLVLTTAGLGIPPGSSDEQFIVARTAPEVGSVRALRRDGSADETATVDGTVVLATRTGFDTAAQLQALDTAGAPWRAC